MFAHDVKQQLKAEDLKSKSVSELQELLERQENILSKRSFVSKLPDKGEKMQHVKEMIEAELSSRTPDPSVTALSSIMAATTLDAVEWNLKRAQSRADDRSDASEPTDPLFSMLTTDGENKGQKDLPPYAEDFCQKQDSKKPPDLSTDKFLPFRNAKYTTLTNPSAIGIEKKVSPLPLKESLVLQKKHAVSEKSRTQGGGSLLTSWREMATMDSESEDEAEAEQRQKRTEEEEDEAPEFDSLLTD